MSDEKEIVLNKVKQSSARLHYSVANLLKKMGWSITMSAAYFDDIRNQVRELDIRACSYISSCPDAPLNILLFIECKYIRKGNWIFYIDTENKFQITKDDPIRAIKVGNNQEELAEALIEKHHYFQRFEKSERDNSGIQTIIPHKPQIARLFETTTEKDSLYESLYQCIKPLIDYRKDNGDFANYQIMYPIVVVDGEEMFSYPMEKLQIDSKDHRDLKPHLNKIVDFITVHFNYKDKGTEEVFFVDIVRKDYLMKFIKTYLATTDAYIDMFSDNEFGDAVQFCHRLKEDKFFKDKINKKRETKPNPAR